MNRHLPNMSKMIIYFSCDKLSGRVFTGAPLYVPTSKIFFCVELPGLGATDLFSQNKGFTALATGASSRYARQDHCFEQKRELAHVFGDCHFLGRQPDARNFHKLSIWEKEIDSKYTKQASVKISLEKKLLARATVWKGTRRAQKR